MFQTCIDTCIFYISNVGKITLHNNQTDSQYKWRLCIYIFAHAWFISCKYTLYILDYMCILQYVRNQHGNKQLFIVLVISTKTMCKLLFLCNHLDSSSYNRFKLIYAVVRKRFREYLHLSPPCYCTIIILYHCLSQISTILYVPYLWMFMVQLLVVSHTPKQK